jgi:CheY-like chemotaxis protein
MDQNFPILVVDDDVVSRTVVEKYLRKAGMNVATAGKGAMCGCGRQALALFDDLFFPIVVTDWMMPEIDGPHLCRLIREKKTEGTMFLSS